MQRRDIERYYSVSSFGFDSRLYIFNRICNLVKSSEFDIQYNSGENFNGEEWSPKYPTDSHIIMWMFCTIFQRSYRNEELNYKIKIYYDYSKHQPSCSEEEDSPIILQTAPNDYAPFYKVISGSKELNCKPGKDNVFYAILFFLYVLKCNKRSIYGSVHQTLLNNIFK